MFGGQKKPYTAVTVQIERLTSEQYEENDLGGIVDLVEVIRLQDSGPTEAARALRKKLKYGSVHRQLRALTILDGLMQNAGPRFQRTFLDEPLLERLRIAATDPVSDSDVKAKCKILFGQWAVAYKSTPGMERIVSLYKQLPQKKRPAPQQHSKVLQETERDAETEDDHGGSPATSPDLSGNRSSMAATAAGSSSGPSSRPIGLGASPQFGATSKSKSSKSKTKAKPFNLEKEKPQLLQSIASASVASTNLMNGLRFINRENKRVSEDPELVKRFETCKLLRRQILRYIQNVESEQWLGSLIHANEELVTALTSYETLDKSVDDDSDSEGDWESSPASPGHSRNVSSGTTEALAGLSLGGDQPPAKPPRPGMSIPMPPREVPGKARAEEPESESEPEPEEEDEDDPFADRNAVKTPHIERPGMTWREV